MSKGQLCVFDVTLKASAANASVDKIKSFLRKWCKKWTFQKESGEKTGYVHYQMRLSLKSKRYMSTLLKACNLYWGKGFGDLSPTSKENADLMNIMGEAFYCMKEDTRIEGPWTDRDDTGPPKFIPHRFRQPKLKDWQQRLQQMMTMQKAQRDSRHIILVHNPTGGVGKSWFMGNMMCNHGWKRVPSSCKNPQEMIQWLASDDSIPEGWDGYLMCDVPRAVSPKHWWTLAQGLEEIKQGHFYDQRYKMKDKWIEAPAMCVFCNTKPPPEVMSKDVFIIFDDFTDEPDLHRGCKGVPFFDAAK